MSELRTQKKQKKKIIIYSMSELGIKKAFDFPKKNEKKNDTSVDPKYEVGK